MQINLPLKGSCLCGAVQVSITALPLLTLACHCRDCQKLSASAYTLTTMFPSASFSHTGQLITGGRGRKGQAHYFCKSCLGFLFSRIGAGSDRINLRTSVLEQAALFQPFIELMAAEKMPWATAPVVHSFDEYPESQEELQLLMDEYAGWLSAR